MKPIRQPRPRGKKFDCPFKGHSPHPGLPPEVGQVGKLVLSARICKKCMTTYYEIIGEASPIVSPEGAKPLVTL